MASRKTDVDESQFGLFSDHSAAKHEVDEAKARVQYTREQVDQLQHAKYEPITKFRIRVYPFSKNSSFEKVEPVESQALGYVQKLLVWLKAKPKPIFVLVEKDDVVWRLWSNETGVWEEERLHGEG